MDGDVIQYTFEDYAESGRMPQLYEDAKAISKAPLYIQSDPVLTLMESMSSVEYDDYQSGGDSPISYKFSKLENKEDYIRRLQEAYISDMYSDDVASNTKESYDSYTIFVKSWEPITMKGGIVDSYYAAEGMQYLTRDSTTKTPQYEYSKIYFNRDKYPQTCAVLDDLR